MTKITQKGFTLLEIIVVLAIFAVMTSIVVFNYGKFTSQTILTNMAYEVALSIREAQIYGVSVRSPDGTLASNPFSLPYGVYFQEGTNTYYLFADEDIDGEFDGSDCASVGAECVTPYTMQRGIIVSEVRQNCIVDPDGLSVTFKRPNPEAKFDGAINVSSADIQLTAPDGAVRYVVIRNNGQIYVTDVEPICS